MRFRLEVIQIDGPRRGIGMDNVDEVEALAEQWAASGPNPVIIIASGPNPDSFSMRTFRSRNDQVTRRAWRTWINTRFVGDLDEPLSADPIH